MSEKQLEQDINPLNELIEHKNSEIRALMLALNEAKREIENYELNKKADFLAILKENDVQSIQINI